MFKNLYIFAAVLICNIANAQNVFSPSDSIATYNSSAPSGSVNNPNQPPYYVMSKWVRTKKMTWNTDNFKCYIWNGMNFRMRFPNNYNPANATKYPVVIFFHGGGEIGGIYDNDNQLLWAAQLFEQRINNGEWNGFLIFPQTPSTGWNDYQFGRVNSVLDTLQKYNNSDPDRLITMGLSMGGFGAVYYASLYPGRTAAALGASPPQAEILISNVTDWVHVPVWFANGGTDSNPAPENADQFYTGFRNAGGNIYQSYFSKDGHGTWTDMWNLKNVTGSYITDVYWNTAHKAQPLVYYQHQQFCTGAPISARMGISAGYYAYEWQLNGSTIAGATSNEYTATVAGQYRARFMRIAGGSWSDWSPSPVVISTKGCTSDTLFAEHFTADNSYSSTIAYSSGNYKCQNGVVTSSTDLFTQDATGVQGNRFLIDFTNSGSSCTYTSGNMVWGMPNPINVLANTNYEYSFYVGNQSSNNLAQLVPTINGVSLLLTGSSQTTGTGNASWKKFTYVWNSGSANTATLALINKSTATSGNDFAIDEISFKTQQGSLINSLPVTWLAVGAKLNGKEVQVSWTVSNEINVASYVVQRSTDGLSFSNIATVNATETVLPQKQYGAIDRLPLKGTNYYRILQTDKDGKYTYSKTVLVNVTEAGGLIIYPNPAASTVNVQNGQAIMKLQVFNSGGQMMYEAKPVATQHAIPVQQWAPGVYYISITSGTQVTQSRFIKQ